MVGIRRDQVRKAVTRYVDQTSCPCRVHRAGSQVLGMPEGEKPGVRPAIAQAGAIRNALGSGWIGAMLSSRGSEGRNRPAGSAVTTHF